MILDAFESRTHRKRERLNGLSFLFVRFSHLVPPGSSEKTSESRNSIFTISALTLIFDLVTLNFVKSHFPCIGIDQKGT